MITSIGADVELIKYLYNLGFSFEDYIGPILYHPEAIEIIDFLIDKGFKFAELEYIISEDCFIKYSDAVVHLMGLGFLNEEVSSHIIAYYITGNSVIDDRAVNLITKLNVNITDEYKNFIMNNRVNDLVKYFIYLNRHQFKDDKIIEECEKIYRLIKIKMVLQN